MTKPLVRWTLGKVHPAGLEIFRHACASFRNLYGDRFDYVICHNNLSEAAKKAVAEFGIPLFEQPTKHPGLYPPAGVAWKLYPPRLQPDAHEIFLDNDILLWKKLDALEYFLKGDAVLYTKGLFHAFGRFAPLIPQSFRLNSGFIGVPPNFDFEAALVRLIQRSSVRRWTNKYDEQGIIAVIFREYQDAIAISTEEIGICHGGRLPPATHGYHFVEANAGNTHAWEKFFRIALATLTDLQNKKRIKLM